MPDAALRLPYRPGAARADADTPCARSWLGSAWRRQSSSSVSTHVRAQTLVCTRAPAHTRVPTQSPVMMGSNPSSDQDVWAIRGPFGPFQARHRAGDRRPRAALPGCTSPASTPSRGLDPPEDAGRGPHSPNKSAKGSRPPKTSLKTSSAPRKVKVKPGAPVLARGSPVPAGKPDAGDCRPSPARGRASGVIHASRPRG